MRKNAAIGAELIFRRQRQRLRGDTLTASQRWLIFYVRRPISAKPPRYIFLPVLRNLALINIDLAGWHYSLLNARLITADTQDLTTKCPHTLRDARDLMHGQRKKCARRDARAGS